tara:strand:- start:34 stop:162 length:129 start_codon:yes stop_codon:yes gene_type:complete
MYGGLPTFIVLCTVIIVVDIAIHVMIQMYFEGHPAFNGEQDE